MNGLNKFIAFWECGHIVSVKAILELQKYDKILPQKSCLVCSKLFEGDLSLNQIDLNLSDEDKKALYEKLVHTI